MEKIIKSFILAAVAVAAIIWACSYRFSGLAWFPGFFIALICGLNIVNINRKQLANG